MADGVDPWNTRLDFHIQPSWKGKLETNIYYLFLKRCLVNVLSLQTLERINLDHLDQSVQLQEQHIKQGQMMISLCQYQYTNTQ